MRPTPLRAAGTCLILSLGQLFLELFHPQPQLLYLCLVLFHTPVGVCQLCHLLLELLFELAMHVLQICQLLQGWEGSGHMLTRGGPWISQVGGPGVSSTGMSHLLLNVKA